MEDRNVEVFKDFLHNNLPEQFKSSSGFITNVLIKFSDYLDDKGLIICKKEN